MAVLCQLRMPACHEHLFCALLLGPFVGCCLDHALPSPMHAYNSMHKLLPGMLSSTCEAHCGCWSSS